MKRTTRSMIRWSLYSLMSAAIIWQAVMIVSAIRQPAAINLADKIEVTVSGNVQNPGTYMVPVGTTQYEILKVAGVKTTSDFSGLNLEDEVSGNQNINVGSRNNPVQLNTMARLEFYLGGVAIETPDGMELPVKEGMAITPGLKISTMKSSQAEISINSYSRIDVDGSTEVSIAKIAVENGVRIVEIFQRSGMCWYKIAYSGKDEIIRVVTPFSIFTARGKGADFTVTIKKNGAGIDCRDGIAVVERQRTGEKINLMAGQRAIAYSDDRPFDIQRINQDAALSSRFAELNRKKETVKPEKSAVTSAGKKESANILVCAFPQTFQLISIDFDKGKINTVNIPANTYVGDLASGFSTMGESFLYGGYSFAATILEQLLDVRVTKYAVIEKEDISRVAASLGGVNIVIDEVAASALNMSMGKHKLKNDELLQFMRPGLSGSQDAARRQTDIIKGLFEGFRSKSVVMTALMADQLLSSIESNMTASEIMSYYTGFAAKSQWEMINHNLPAKTVTMQGRVFMEPLPEQCRKLLASGQ